MLVTSLDSICQWRSNGISCTLSNGTKPQLTIDFLYEWSLPTSTKFIDGLKLKTVTLVTKIAENLSMRIISVLSKWILLSIVVKKSTASKMVYNVVCMQ